MANCLLTTALALVPSLLNLFHSPDTVTWRLQCGRCFDLYRASPDPIPPSPCVEPGRFPLWVVIVYAVATVAVASLWLNVAGIPFSPNVGPYAIVLTWALCIFGFTFVRTIELFLHREG